MPKQIKYTDETLFPYGRYVGRKMQDVPAEYLLEQYYNGKLSKPLQAYVEDNKDVLEFEINENK